MIRSPNTVVSHFNRWAIGQAWNNNESIRGWRTNAYVTWCSSWKSKWNCQKGTSGECLLKIAFLNVTLFEWMYLHQGKDLYLCIYIWTMEQWIVNGWWKKSTFELEQTWTMSNIFAQWWEKVGIGGKFHASPIALYKPWSCTRGVMSVNISPLG